MIRNIIVFALTFCVMLTVGYLDIAMGGTIACPGQISTSTIMGDNIISHTSYVLRNFNNTKTIDINRIVVYDASGSVRCDFPNVNSFPATFNSSLQPHQSTKIFTVDMTAAGCISLQTEGTIQTVITWSFSSGETGEPLNVLATPINMNTKDKETFGMVPIVCSALNAQ